MPEIAGCHCRLGSIARKHGSYASCVRMTNTLYGFNAMEVQEAFVKIREQVLPLGWCAFSFSHIHLFPYIHQEMQVMAHSILAHDEMRKEVRTFTV